MEKSSNVILGIIEDYRMENLDLELKMSHEDKLLILCARTRMNSEIETQIRSLILKENIDWDYLIKIASKHRLKPLLYFHLNRICPEAIPETVLNNLKDNFHKNAKNNLLMTGELIKVLDLMKSNDIIAIPYKGPFLADLIYKDITLRQFDDIDVLVDKKDVLRAKEVLISNGYRPQFKLNASQERLYLKTQREYKFVNDLNNVSIEIQWKYAGLSFNFSDDPSLIFNFKNLEKVNFKGIEVFNIPPEDLLLILCIHNAGHYWKRLAWITDISELINTYKEMDWAKITDKGKKIGVERILNINLLLATNLIGLELPKEIKIILNSDKLAYSLYLKIIEKFLFGKKYNLLKKGFLRFKIREKWTKGLKDCFYIFTAPTMDEWKIIELPSILFPLYYLIRPIHVLTKKKE